MGKVKDTDTIESRIDELLKEAGLPGIDLSGTPDLSVTAGHCQEILAQALEQIVEIKKLRRGRLVDMAELIDQDVKEESEKKITVAHTPDAMSSDVAS
tara:strand:+ start:136 stop:429 length:294 start_codon:yes stop_codon:yes gene_type:complete